MKMFLFYFVLFICLLKNVIPDRLLAEVDLDSLLTWFSQVEWIDVTLNKSSVGGLYQMIYHLLYSACKTVCHL